MTLTPDQEYNPAATGNLQTISVIELDFHHDCLDAFLKTFKNTHVRIHVFTTSRNLRLLAGNSYSGNIMFYEYKGGSKYFFLKKHNSLIDKSQVVFIDTVASDFGAYLAVRRSATTILRVHNVNKQFSPFKHLVRPPSLFFAWKFFSYILRQIVCKGFPLFRPIINRRISYFTFPDSGITCYVKQQNYVEEKKIIPPLPLRIFSESDTAFASFTKVLNVVIIGATDQRRRQYEEVINALTKIFRTTNPPAIQLTLLGNSNNAYGTKVKQQLRLIEHPSFSLKTFDKQVPEKQFVECIKQAHLVISPITSNATTDIFREYYGKSKTTGSILDFMRFGKLTLVPSHYMPPHEFSDYILKYESSEHLGKIILELSGNSKLNEINRRSMDFVRNNYSAEAALSHTISIFNAIIAHEKAVL